VGETAQAGLLHSIRDRLKASGDPYVGPDSVWHRALRVARLSCCSFDNCEHVADAEMFAPGGALRRSRQELTHIAQGDCLG
jgi:hypothetical protein